MRGKKVIEYFPALLAGIIIGYFSTQFVFFDIEKDINLVEVIGIAVNIILAYFISRVLEKRKTEDRIEKDMLIEKMKNIINISSKIMIQDGKILFSDAITVFKELSAEMTSLKRLLEYTEIKIDVTKINELKNIMIEYKKIVTDQKVKEENLLFDALNLNRVMVSGRQFRDYINRLIVDCNRC